MKKKLSVQDGHDCLDVGHYTDGLVLAMHDWYCQTWLCDQCGNEVQCWYHTLDRERDSVYINVDTGEVDHFIGSEGSSRSDTPL